MSEDLLGVVRALVMVKHAKGLESPELVFNRVFEKAVRLTLNDDAASVPRLNRKNTSVSLETLETAALVRMANRSPRDMSTSPYPPGSPKRFKRRVRKNASLPVVVVNYCGRDYLVDGNRRVNYWLEKGAPTMQAYVVVVR